MAHLTLNGIDVPCSVGQARRTPVYTGGSGRAFSGRPRRSWRVARREWRFRTGLLALAEAEAFRGLINGLGQHFPLDADAYADTGLGVYQQGSTGISYGGPGSLANHGNYLICAGYSANVYWKPTGGPTDANWTVLASAYHNDPATAWRRWVLRADAKWRDGTRDDANSLRTVWFDSAAGILYVRSAIFNGADWTAATVKAPGNRTKGTNGATTYAFEVTSVTGDAKTGATPPVWPTGARQTVVDGNVTWVNTGADSGNGYCGDLVWLPYKVPDAWVPSITAFHQANPWSALPRLVAGGDFAGGASVSVLGEAGEGERVEYMSAGVWTLGEQFDFVLQEV